MVFQRTVSRALQIRQQTVRKSFISSSLFLKRRDESTQANIASEIPTNCECKVTGEGSEPNYARTDETADEIIIHSPEPFATKHGGILPDVNIAYEAWGQLNNEKDNVILLNHGLSASSHAKTNSNNPISANGWWEKFIGPGLSIDTNKFYVICVNHLGSCFGTSGPSTINTTSGKHFGSDFPIVTIEDMVRVQFRLLDIFGIEKVHASVGASLGGKSSLLSPALFPDRINRMVSISAAAASPPSSIAFRYLQRVALMNDPKWNNGHYYDGLFPTDGTRLARKIATLTYRSGPEWEKRFKTEKINHPDAVLPRYHEPEFLIEDYIRHQGETFMAKTKFDPNSLIYLSKAADLFDMSNGFQNLEESFARIKCPSLIMGATSDILYPITKQKEMADLIEKGGNKDVLYYADEGYFGHDTFLLDVEGMGIKMKEFLEA
ncbi:uncharacterized protein [Clytia hemisphaerica]|uniref:AB hydrolase-1 domain-containing protein n=1 Tax=Clytia hemisphaerica TaxID=252671 RepID=A0A7M5XB99_9CNID